MDELTGRLGMEDAVVAELGGAIQQAVPMITCVRAGAGRRAAVQAPSARTDDGCGHQREDEWQRQRRQGQHQDKTSTRVRARSIRPTGPGP